MLNVILTDQIIMTFDLLQLNTFSFLLAIQIFVNSTSLQSELE